jgi:hypothetical protein
MAAAVGFIDSSYSLVALEDDALPPEEAVLYAESGVPDLLESEIFANAEDLELLPSAQWVGENQPQTIWAYTNSYYDGSRFWLAGGMVDVNVDMDWAEAPAVDEAALGEALMPMPMAQETSYTPDAVYEDYSAEVAHLVRPELNTRVFHFASIQGDYLLIDLSALNLMKDSRAVLNIYNLKGSLIYSTEFQTSSDLSNYKKAVVDISGETGMYLIEIRAENKEFHQGLMIPVKF